MPRPPSITVFKQFPKELFRVNNGPQVKLRAWSPRPQVYDIFAEHGLVAPKALNPLTYRAPNGASMRPNSRYQQSLVSWRFRGADTIVYCIPEGTDLPSDLLLVHERSDHYSLQPAEAMTLHDLNTSITRFFTARGTILEREAWLRAYPEPTEKF